jgi:hypothetical protein
MAPSPNELSSHQGAINPEGYSAQILHGLISVIEKRGACCFEKCLVLPASVTQLSSLYTLPSILPLYFTVWILPDHHTLEREWVGKVTSNTDYRTVY